MIVNEYNANTEEALALGFFVAPSFSVENEIFWGGHRFEDAIGYLGEREK